jgi:AmmeMemoRadiSam system protein B/AmmeMemoRadiSam system protein A
MDAAATGPSGPPRRRPPAVAGLFYPATREALEADVEDALRQARHVSLPPPKALVVPHAGYVYSGVVAGAAYSLVDRASVRRVVLLGPCHRVPIRGLALPDADAFDTPLGSVDLDRDAVARIADLGQVVRSPAAHAREHSLEVQLPFLQRRLGEFRLLPLAVGDASQDEVAEVLDRLWGGPETLIVVSSDLSHYHRYDEARAIDAATARAIVALDSALDHEQACGATPLAGLLAVARRRGMHATLLDLRNSGDTAGDRSRVVGYGAFALHERGAAQEALDDAKGRELCAIARASIGQAFGDPAPARSDAGWLLARRATFVTLRKSSALRGCIGTIEVVRPLRDDVAHNAVAAALRDPRFPPLARDELDRTTIEVALLSERTPIAFADRAELLARLVPGRDGVVLSAGTKRATFLPQVWQTVADGAEFIDELVRKAGLPPDVPLERCTVERYRVQKWSEGDDAR